LRKQLLGLALVVGVVSGVGFLAFAAWEHGWTWRGAMLMWATFCSLALFVKAWDDAIKQTRRQREAQKERAAPQMNLGLDHERNHDNGTRH
jgi:cyanate permease